MMNFFWFVCVVDLFPQDDDFFFHQEDVHSLFVYFDDPLFCFLHEIEYNYEKKRRNFNADFLSESFVSDFLFASTSSQQTSRLSLLENGGSMWCPFQEWNQIIVVCIDRQEFYLDIGCDQLHLWWAVRHFITNTSCIGISLPFEMICCLFRILIIPNYHLWISSSTDS